MKQISIKVSIFVVLIFIAIGVFIVYTGSRKNISKEAVSQKPKTSLSVENWKYIKNRVINELPRAWEEMSETDEYKALKAKGATQDELTARFITRVNALVAERVSITPGEVVKAVAESMKK